jgi:hypothetical protein
MLFELCILLLFLRWKCHVAPVVQSWIGVFYSSAATFIL